MATVIYRPYLVTQNSTGSQLPWTLGSCAWSRHDKEKCSCGPLSAVALPDGSLSGKKNTGLLEFSAYRPAVTPTGTLNGIELMLYAHKQSRVLDKTIQLKHDGALIGNNQATGSAGGYHVYGGSADKWGTTLSLSNIPSLTVVLQYKSNNSVPHRDNVYVDTAWLRITYTP